MNRLLPICATALLTAAIGGCSQPAGSDPVTAQQDVAAPAAAAPLVEIEDDNFIVRPFNLTVEQVEDLDVYDAAGHEIGEVEEVLADSHGQVVALAIDVSDYFGVEEREAVFHLDQVQLTNDRLVTRLTKEQIRQLPLWGD
jgi:sporulation protein YlmC with PRC-barrel domain